MTNEKPLLLGSHVSMSGNKMLLGSSEDALELRCNYIYDLYRSSSKYTKKTD